MTLSFPCFIITSPFAVCKYVPIVYNAVRVEYSIYQNEKNDYNCLINHLSIEIMKHNLTSLPLPSENGCISLRNFFIKYLFEIYLSLN